MLFNFQELSAVTGEMISKSRKLYGSFFTHMSFQDKHTCSHRYNIHTSTLILSSCILLPVTPAAPAAPAVLYALPWFSSFPFFTSFAQFSLLYSYIYHLCSLFPLLFHGSLSLLNQNIADL